MQLTIYKQLMNTILINVIACQAFVCVLLKSTNLMSNNLLGGLKYKLLLFKCTDIYNIFFKTSNLLKVRRKRFVLLHLYGAACV